MTLTCPHCGFSKEIDPARIPDTARKVVCPRCKEPFVLSEAMAPEAGVANKLPVSPPEPDFSPVAVAPEVIVAPPPMTSATSLPKAGFWIRVIASLIDSLLAGMVQVVFTLILGLTASTLAGEMDPQGEAAISMLTTLFSIMFGCVYYIFFTGYCGQTPGKMALRIKVIRTSGADIGYGRAFLREVPGKFLSGILLCIGYLMVVFDDQKQGLHDRVADTYVIKL
jgi:predicted Zn finger-like uncharacterized protein